MPFKDQIKQFYAEKESFVFKFVQWAIFLLIFVSALFAPTGDSFGTKAMLGLLLAAVGTFIASLFLRPLWNMFAGMFGHD